MTPDMTFNRMLVDISKYLTEHLILIWLHKSYLYLSQRDIVLW